MGSPEGYRATNRELWWGVKPHTIRHAIGGVLARASAATGCPRFTAHGLRRHAVDALARSGVDSSEAAALLGHSETVMLRYYRTVRLSDLEAIARSCPFDKETT